MAFAIFGSVSLIGCHDWPDERVTAIEAQNILRELSEIDAVPEPNIPIPAIYKLPPRKVKHIVGGAEEWKLFYFAKYHTAEKLQQIIHDQFATAIFNEKGKSTIRPDYTVTANPDTNQLIVRAPTEMDIDAVLETIEWTDVPPIQVRIDCMVSEVYADLTVDRQTSILIENLFGEMVNLQGAEDNSNVAFPGAALRDPAREKFGLKIGLARGEQGHRFQALVDILVSRGYLKILLNPSLEVVNGQTASIQATEHVPLQQVTVQSGGFGGTPILRTQTEYEDIIDSLKITPHVYADGYIGLETEAQIAAYLTPEGIKQLPIVTKRQITNKDNRIRHGDSLIIGGIRKSEKRDVVRGVPVLKDVPGLNLLFSGRDFEERAKEVIFIITPTISTGGVPNEDIVEMLRDRHLSPMTQDLHEQMMDPLGTRARQQEQERIAEDARTAQKECETEITAARIEAMETGRQIDELEAGMEEAVAREAELAAKADEATSRAEKAAAEAQRARAEAQQAKDEALQARAATEKARQDTEKTQAEIGEKPEEPAEQDAGNAPSSQGNKNESEKPEDSGESSQ